jgi:hypothetical protein
MKSALHRAIDISEDILDAVQHRIEGIRHTGLDRVSRIGYGRLYIVPYGRHGIPDLIIVVHIDRDFYRIIGFSSAQEAHSLHMQRDSEEHNHVGSCCLGIAQSGDMLFGN